MTSKKILCVSLVIIMLFTNINVYADTFVIPQDDNTHYYLYNHIDFTEWSSDEFLTTNNYNNNYDVLSGDLKTQINNKFVDSNNSYTNALINDLLACNYNNDSGINASGLYFTPIVVDGQIIPIEDCKKYIGIFTGSGSGYILLTLYLYYCPAGDDIIISNQTVYCNSIYYGSYTPYVMTLSNIDGVQHGNYSRGTIETFTGSLNSQSGKYQNITNSNLYCIYSDMVYLFTYLTNYNANLDNDFEVYQAYNNQSNICPDRRTNLFINKVNGGSNIIDENIGFIDGSFSCLVGGSDLSNQLCLVAYQLNNYSKTLNNNLKLKLNYQFYCTGQYNNNDFKFDGNYYDSNNTYDSYNIDNSNIIAVNLSQAFNNIYGSDLIAGDFGLSIIWQIGNNVNFSKDLYSANDFIKSLMNIGGFSLTKRNQDFNTVGGKNFWSSIPSAFNSAVNFVDEYIYPTGIYEDTIKFNYDNSKNAVFTDAYLLITMFIEDSDTGKSSNSFVYKYNYLDGSVQTVGNITPSSVETFDGLYDTSNFGTSTDLVGGNGYGGSAYGGGASASVGDITINAGIGSIPYILVDIPENEWINKTPNLATLLNEFKTMLSETKEQSVLSMLPATYNYLPAPFMQYMLYGVGLIVMIGIWRAITRR